MDEKRNIGPSGEESPHVRESKIVEGEAWLYSQNPMDDPEKVATAQSHWALGGASSERRTLPQKHAGPLGAWPGTR